MRNAERDRGKANCLEEGTNALHVHDKRRRTAVTNGPKRFIVGALAFHSPHIACRNLEWTFERTILIGYGVIARA
jgi:hypothetical protein